MVGTFEDSAVRKVLYRGFDKNVSTVREEIALALSNCELLAFSYTSPYSCMIWPLFGICPSVLCCSVLSKPLLFKEMEVMLPHLRLTTHNYCFLKSAVQFEE